MTGDPPERSPEFADDYDALRHVAGAVVIGRDIVSVVGPDAIDYLQGQCSQDIAALTVGTSADALILTPQGKLDALVRVTRLGDEELYLDVDAGFGAAVVARLARFKLRVKVDIALTDWSCVALRGPEARRRVEESAGSPGTVVVAPYDWNGVVGVDLMGPDPRTPDVIRRCGPESWQSVRVEAGIPVMGAELDERTIAAEAGLLDRCVSFTKGCYTGQELVARLDSRGNKVSRRLRGLVMELSSGASTTPTPGAEVKRGDRVVGRVTSVAWSPALGAAVALAYLHRDVEPPCPVDVMGDDPAGGVFGAQARVLPLVS
jgi:tRNA-modifying protein YgfZ